MKKGMCVLSITICLCFFVVIHSSLAMATQHKISFIDVASTQAHMDSYLQTKQAHQRELAPLAMILNLQSSQKNISIYFEDLTTGAYFSINNDARYVPGSIFKIITFMAVLKQVEDQHLSLNDSIVIIEEDRNEMYGDLWKNKAGYNMTVIELLELAAIQSDNTAGSALRRIVPHDVYVNMLFACGIPYNSPIEKNLPQIRAKDVGTLFRSMYVDSCLRNPSNDMVLSLLSQSQSGLNSYLPNDVVVAHKMGVWYEGNYHHDCGIIFHEKRPYVLCIMTKDLPLDESNELIGSISEQVYRFINSTS